jgi:acetoin utilization deacetylase AcuC-like enzyme/GNAT superfamily N-acetyltransferase
MSRNATVLMTRQGTDMFRIRRIHDDLRPVNQTAINQVQQILRDQFPSLAQGDIDKIPELLRNPLKQGMKSILYVAENARQRIQGFAMISHEADLRFCFLDYISTAKRTTGGGIGGALYEHVREEATAMAAIGIFFECLPDDPALCKDPEILKQNQARLRFYEKYGAFPIIGTAYETPVKEDEDNPPYLVFDALGQSEPLPCATARRIVRTILELRYGNLCSPEYIDHVVTSFVDDPVRLRAPRYHKKPAAETRPSASRQQRIALVINERHEIHHVRERGYVEAPVRVRSILRELNKTSLFQQYPPRTYSERFLTSTHDRDYVEYFRKVCRNLPAGQSIYPYVFPIRNSARPPKELAVRAGYFCIDTFTPLNANAWKAAKGAVDCTLTAAATILEGYRLAYALVRPPGHHAERRAFGGFCYFNNAAIAAQMLSDFGRVAILDIDYHHGNGQQAIFYQRSDVLTVSIHGHPRFAYPYFSGFEDETGEAEGLGFNMNLPLAEQITSEQYLSALGKGLKRVARFRPDYLVVCVGFDTAKGDPTGTWGLNGGDFNQIGQVIGRMKLPTLLVQEGGYRTRSIGGNARNFFTGIWAAAFGA